ncbi:MAG: DNA repair protein RecN [Treponema sp.]|jgi:DNA repair protein RecN (Recombination protein N)|nr:DNA repair protein RecN [Treponema sp.]
MLEELTVRNYALIDNLTISFQGGFNVLTGETGAGKSIIVGALSFLLGARTDAEVIRTGAEEASVSAVLTLGEQSRDALEWLKGRDIEIEDGQLIIRRNIKTTGRGAIYIQNVPVTRNDLEEFMAFLFDLHGQHAHESLMKKESHRRYLDRFAGIENEVMEFNRVFLTLAEKKKAFEASVSSERDRNMRLEVLNYAVEEIKAAGIKSGESRELEAEAAKLGDFEKLVGLVNTSAESFCEGESSLIPLARRTRNALDNAAAIDSDLTAMRRRFEDLFYEAEDLSAEFRSYRDSLQFDPARLEEVEERLAMLYRLKKKYAGNAGATTGEDAVLAYQEQAEAEIEALTGAEENRDKLKAEIVVLEKDIAARSASLSGKRSLAAVNLGKRISGIILNLGMPNARFSVSVTGKGKSLSGNFVIGPWGADEVEFLISANTGEPLKELAKIASGGELSRVMLAIKTALSDNGAVSGGGAAKEEDVSSGSDASAETLIFDEIDAGIGGEVALMVGEYLARVGEQKQIFCVTHLASIAVRADNHFKVEKRIVDGGGNSRPRTVTTVKELNGKVRREEIARMLAGDSGGSVALAHAEELLSRYKRS